MTDGPLQFFPRLIRSDSCLCCSDLAEIDSGNLYNKETFAKISYSKINTIFRVWSSIYIYIEKAEQTTEKNTDTNAPRIRTIIILKINKLNQINLTLISNTPSSIYIYTGKQRHGIFQDVGHVFLLRRRIDVISGRLLSHYTSFGHTRTAGLLYMKRTINISCIGSGFEVSKVRGWWSVWDVWGMGCLLTNSFYEPQFRKLIAEEVSFSPLCEFIDRRVLFEFGKFNMKWIGFCHWKFISNVYKKFPLTKL